MSDPIRRGSKAIVPTDQLQAVNMGAERLLCLYVRDLLIGLQVKPGEWESLTLTISSEKREYAAAEGESPFADLQALVIRAEVIGEKSG